MSGWLHAPYQEKPDPPSRLKWFVIGFMSCIAFVTLVKHLAGPS